MNERIQELAKQARKKPLGNSWCYTNPAEFEQKFAKLIVKECAKVIFETPVDYMETDTMHRIRDSVKQHFGV